MIESYSLNEMVILDNKFRKFLKMKSTEIKYNVYINYLLCNYFDDVIDQITSERTYHLRQNIKSFLINDKKYNGDDYNREGVKLLLNNYISKREIIITI
jgi:hypothetical protein